MPTTFQFCPGEALVVWTLLATAIMLIEGYDDRGLLHVGDGQTLPTHLEDQRFDYNLSEWQERQLENMTYSGRRCMLDVWASPHPEGVYCNGTWDKLLCWPSTSANSSVFLPCPIGKGLTNNTASAFRRCDAAGEWVGGRSNYSICLDLLPVPPEEETGPKIPDNTRLALTVAYIYFFGGIASFLLLSLTLFIFSYFKTLQCNRVSIHKNLVVSFLVRSLIDIIMYEPFISNRLLHSYLYVGWLCRTVISLQQYAILANVFWMFVEGLFLHNRVAVSVFNAEAPLRIFYVVGWGLPGVFVVIWAVCLHIYNQQRCWSYHSSMPFIYIIIAPVVIALLINAIFLVNIIRILITKLRANNTLETDQFRKAVKATAVLFPLLGMTNLLFFFKPSSSSRTMEIAYRCITAVLTPSQGIFVSVIYCFMNSDVRAAINKKWQRYQMHRLGTNRGRRRSSRTSSLFISTSENGNQLKCNSTGC